MTIASHILRLLTARERRNAVLLFILMILGVLLETFSISLIIPALTLMTQPGGSARFVAVMAYFPDAVQRLSPQDLVLWGMAGLVMVYLLKTVFLMAIAWFQTLFAFKVQTRVSRQLLATYLSQPYTFHLQRNSAQLIFNTTTGINLFAGAILHGLIVMTESMVLGTICLLLLSVEPLGTLAVAGTLGLVAGTIYRITRRRVAAWGQHYQFHEGMRIQHIQQGLGGVKEILLLGRADNFVEQYARHSAVGARMARYQSTLENVPRLTLEALAVAALASLVFIMVLQGKEMTTIVPTLGLFATAAFRLIPSANRILNSLNSLSYHGSAVETLHRELTEIAPVATVPLTNQGHTDPVAWTEIAVRNVSYAYDGSGKNALNNIDLSIPRGTSIGLIGTSGSGKSTLVDILLGLLEPTSGQITLNGTDIRTSLRHWQQQIGYVPQTIFLTDETLRQNIAFGIAPDAIDDTAIERALKAAQLYDFAQQLPEGVMTNVGERGVRLSGGQRQRIGIARALYHDPQVLVMDEATSALDTETEEDVMGAIAALHGEKTIIMVAHRTSTVSQCDMLYRLDSGRVVARGKPSEVL
jgi:ATP-binding cassette, subfamily B, bacterial PglK